MLTPALRRALAVATATALTAIVVPLTLGTVGAAAAAGAPVVELQSGTNGCQGVLPTPGSENTNKRLVGGSLLPGGSATFQISYPVDAADVAGRTTFVITDCVFIDGTAFAKYLVSFVPNTEDFVLTYTLHIPNSSDLGSEFCNYAKTTAAPSDSPASNRKAGPACFRIGGDLRIVKKAGDTGDTLAGASFSVSCDPPGAVPSIPPVVISGVSGTTTVVGDAYVASGVVATGEIAIAGPIGTACAVTETAPPAGYQLADPTTRTVNITDAQETVTFVDPRKPNTTTISTVATAADLGSSVSDTATLAGATANAGGTITFSVYDTKDCSNDPVFTTTAAVDGNNDYASKPFTPTTAGSYYWIAAYSGDATNSASTGKCGDKAETSVVTGPSLGVSASSSSAALAATGAGHVNGELGWAVALLALGAGLSMAGVRRYRRTH